MNSPLVPYTGFVEIPFPHRQIIFSYFIRLHLEAENCTNIRIVKIILCHNHDVNINPTGVESRIFQTLIDDLANRGTSVLVVVAASSEILTGADNLFEFDQEGNCYQKLDHQNHRLQK